MSCSSFAVSQESTLRCTRRSLRTTGSPLLSSGRARSRSGKCWPSPDVAFARDLAYPSGLIIARPTPEKRTRNGDLAYLRTRVEMPFGWVPPRARRSDRREATVRRRTVILRSVTPDGLIPDDCVQQFVVEPSMLSTAPDRKNRMPTALTQNEVWTTARSPSWRSSLGGVEVSPELKDVRGEVLPLFVDEHDKLVAHSLDLSS
jgi:hypothetical protein